MNRDLIGSYILGYNNNFKILGVMNLKQLSGKSAQKIKDAKTDLSNFSLAELLAAIYYYIDDDLFFDLAYKMITNHKDETLDYAQAWFDRNYPGAEEEAVENVSLANGIKKLENMGLSF